MTGIPPGDALREPGAAAPDLPVCDHYAGVEGRMRKSLELQAEPGPVFDVTLDNEDGAPVGAEIEQAHLIAELLGSAANRFGRVGVRLLAVDHPRFADVAGIRHRDALHDRASYRYFWQVLQRAQRTAFQGGPQLPAELRRAWFGLS